MPNPEWYSSGLPHIWLPYTQMKLAPAPLPVVSTQGCRITLADGRELIDGIASWWSACHGYNHPHIIAAVEKQLHAMPHVMFGGLVHEQALTLAERLCSIAPKGLERVFFSDSGSVAVEVAMKMALQYWRNKAKPGRDRFVCFTNGYHGDTLAAMSVSDPEKSMHKAFRHAVINQYVVDIPSDEYALAELDALLSGVQKEIAGMIIEPLVQGAGGMHFHSADILAELYRLAKKYNMLFIADEIATGFGRTGNMFACDEAGITPDIMCVGKALAGGTISLAASLARTEIFEAFLSDDREAALMHGPTFMANALACAAANASLDLFGVSGIRNQVSETSSRGSAATAAIQKNKDWIASPAARNDKANPSDTRHPTPDTWQRRVEAIETQLREELEPCRALPNVVDVRVKGAIGVVQLASEVDVHALRPKFIEHGVWVRPFNDIIYLMPPLVISTEELATLTKAVRAVLCT